MGTVAKRPSKTFEWLNAHRNYDGDECLIWPYAKVQCGYGQIHYEGKMYGAHRLMCEWTHGPRPSKKHVVRHSCGRGHEGCVNPKHLSYGTYSQNQLDRAAHGTKNTGRQGKLTQAQKEEIRALNGTMTHKEIGEKYGVLACRISQIVNETRRVPRGASFIRGRWLARIRVRGKTTHLGSFQNEADATSAFNAALERVRNGLPPKAA